MKKFLAEQNINLPKLTNEERLLAGTVVLMCYRGFYDPKFLPVMVENAVPRIPGLNEEKPFDTKPFVEKVSALGYQELTKLFEKEAEQVALPDFSQDEMVIIANCICGSITDGFFVQFLDEEVSDYIYYNNILPSGKTDLSETDKAFVSKVKNLSYIQRVKLIYIIKRDFFKKR